MVDRSAVHTGRRGAPHRDASGGSSKLRVTRRWGPARIAYLLGLQPSTVHRVLSRYGLARLPGWTGPPAGRSAATNTPRPASWSTSMSRSSARSPTAGAGGCWDGGRQAQRRRQAAAPPARPRGYHYLHTALDDHSRLAYSELLTDERQDTAAAFWRRANAWFTNYGVAVRRVLTDNGPATGPAHSPPPWATDQAQTDPPLPATDQRQGRALPPHPGRRMGLRPPLPHRHRTLRRLTPTGSTPTITTAATPHSAANHPPAASLTSQVSTPRPSRCPPLWVGGPVTVPYARPRGRAVNDSAPILITVMRYFAELFEGIK